MTPPGATSNHHLEHKDGVFRVSIGAFVATVIICDRSLQLTYWLLRLACWNACEACEDFCASKTLLEERNDRPRDGVVGVVSLQSGAP